MALEPFHPCAQKLEILFIPSFSIIVSKNVDAVVQQNNKNDDVSQSYRIYDDDTYTRHAETKISSMECVV